MTDHTRIAAAAALGAFAAGFIIMVAGPGRPPSSPEPQTTTFTERTTTTQDETTPEEWCQLWEDDASGLGGYLVSVDHIGLHAAYDGITWSEWGFSQGLLSRAEALRWHDESAAEVDALCEEMGG